MMNKEELYDKCVELIVNRPTVIDGHAVWNGQKYQNLDDAWDWFEQELDSYKHDIAEQIMGVEEARMFRQDLNEIIHFSPVDFTKPHTV